VTAQEASDLDADAVSHDHITSAADPMNQDGEDMTSSQIPALDSYLAGVGVEEMLGTKIATTTSFLDSAGRSVQIGDYLGKGRPVILNLVYHNCPMLCSIALDALGTTLGDLAWTPGNEFDVLTVSFGAGETPEMAAAAKDRMISSLGRRGAEDGWHFLVGEEESIMELTGSVGYTFKWIASRKEYAHPAVVVLLAEDGTITRYLHGIDVAASDVRRGLVEASNGEVGTAVDQFLMYCFQYDPGSNSYVLHATNLMKLGGMFTLLMLGAGLFVFWRKEQHDQVERVHQT